jgi:hypothetical protein
VKRFTSDERRGQEFGTVPIGVDVSFPKALVSTFVTLPRASSQTRENSGNCPRQRSCLKSQSHGDLQLTRAIASSDAVLTRRGPAPPVRAPPSRRTPEARRVPGRASPKGTHLVREVAALGPNWIKMREDDNLGATAKIPPEVYRRKISPAPDQVFERDRDDAGAGCARCLRLGLVVHRLQHQPQVFLTGDPWPD